MNRRTILHLGAGALVAPSLARRALARTTDPFRIGLIWSYTGAGPSSGPEMDAAIAAFMKVHGDHVAGRPVIVVRRDDGGLNPEVARRAAQELIVQQKVDMIAGLIFTANAAAVGDISNQSRTPVMLVNAPTTGILAKYPYMTRWSFTTTELAGIAGEWAAKNGHKTMYAIAVDLQSGIDAVSALKRGFEGGGGKLVGQSAVPVSAGVFSPYIEHAREAKPDTLFVFLNAGGVSAQFLKEAEAAGVQKSGMSILSTGDLVSENNLPQLGDGALGITSVYHYSSVHEGALNATFQREVSAITKGSPNPSFAGVAMWDVLTAAYKLLGARGGDWDVDHTLAALEGYKAESPRGPIAIDAGTRDIVQNIYVRRVERRDGRLANVEFATFPMVRAS